MPPADEFKRRVRSPVSEPNASFVASRVVFQDKAQAPWQPEGGSPVAKRNGFLENPQPRPGRGQPAERARALVPSPNNFGLVWQYRRAAVGSH
jgi:hypothetical protein